MAKIVILGAGVMGSAFDLPLSDAGQQVYLVGTHLDRDWIEAIQKRWRASETQCETTETVVPFT